MSGLLCPCYGTFAGRSRIGGPDLRAGRLMACTPLSPGGSEIRPLSNNLPVNIRLAKHTQGFNPGNGQNNTVPLYKLQGAADLRIARV
jgi:hypothetical protein